VSTETTTLGGNGKGSRQAAETALTNLATPSAATCVDTSPIVTGEDVDMTGRTLYVPQMPKGGSQLLAAALRSIGFDARVVPDSDARTLELGGRYISGEECYPQRICMGDFMKLIEDDGMDPKKLAFMMPTANGPCRFGQYASLQRRVLDDLGYEDLIVLSITSADGYASIGKNAGELLRTGWRAIVVNDILMKLLLKTRPYEITPGDTDATYDRAIETLSAVLSRPKVSNKERMADIKAAMLRAKAAFQAIPVRQEERPLIGVVGEIFCRLNTFANQDLIREIEAQGGECWLAGIAEWIWYTNEEQYRRFREEKRRFGKKWAKAYITTRVQHSEEETIYEDFRDVLHGYEEPHVTEILERSRPYLPQDGAMGEMVLSTGGTIFFHDIGADGVADISPFSCMNGIITEAVYPKVSREHDHIPIRIFYFDGTQSDLERDVGIFLELARTYKRRKKIQRR
jgi:predicted nucleotide-binding protein (sugar kinase/HSP70/actin superfamily)